MVSWTPAEKSIVADALRVHPLDGPKPLAALIKTQLPRRTMKAIEVMVQKQRCIQPALAAPRSKWANEEVETLKKILDANPGARLEDLVDLVTKACPNRGGDAVIQKLRQIAKNNGLAVLSRSVWSLEERRIINRAIKWRPDEKAKSLAARIAPKLPNRPLRAITGEIRRSKLYNSRNEDNLDIFTVVPRPPPERGTDTIENAIIGIEAVLSVVKSVPGLEQQIAQLSEELRCQLGDTQVVLETNKLLQKEVETAKEAIKRYATKNEELMGQIREMSGAAEKALKLEKENIRLQGVINDKEQMILTQRMVISGTNVVYGEKGL